MRRLLLAIVVYAIFMLGCASEKSDFAKAEKENSLQAFETFLQKYPQGEYSTEAAKRIHKLAFQFAMQKDSLTVYKDSLTVYKGSLTVYREFQQKYPENEFFAEVNKRIEELSYQSVKESIDKIRAGFSLPPSRFSLLDADTTISLVLRKTLAVMINFPKPGGEFYPKNVLILEPKTDDSVIYFVSLQRPGYGPIYRVDIAKGTWGKMKCFFLGRSQYEFIVSPDENMLLKLSCDEDEEGCENEEEIGCSPEAFSFCILDLDKNEIRAIGKLPPGYSYATSVHNVSNMSDDLSPTGVYSWSRDDKLIHARIFSSRGSMQYAGPKRKPIGEVKFGPNQPSVKL